MDDVIEQSERVLQKKNMLTRKFDMGIYEKIMRELCPNSSLDDFDAEDLTHEFTFAFRLLMLNLPNFEVEI